jgi:DNA topoisomerase-1
MPRKRTAAGDLVIESPAKAKTIERYPGPGHHVTAGHGRVRDLPKDS